MNEFPPEVSRRFERFLERDDERISIAGRTKLLTHGTRRPRAVVLLHGLSASPSQFVRFASDLYARGHNVLVPRLPRHGYIDRLTPALAGMTETSLCKVTHESLALAGFLGEQVTVAGFSLGGLLAIWAAEREPVERAVAIAPFLGVSWIPNRWMSPIAEILLRLPNRFQWWDPIARERQMPEHGYPRFATHALAHSYRLARTVILDAATHPLRCESMIFVTNSREAAINNRAVRRLAARLRQKAEGRVKLVELTGLPPSHDIIEPLRHPELADRVYPQLLELIDPSTSSR